MNQKFISILLVFLLITSVSIPAASAQPVQFVPAAKLVIDGITVILTSAVIIELGKNIGKTWDGVAENWDNFVKGVSKGLNDIFHAKQWIKVTSPKGKAVMKAVYECFNAGGSSGGKKDDKWYFEARIHDHQIEINPKLMSEEQAVKEMGRGKHIMTVDKELARNAVGRYDGIDPRKVEFEIHQGGKEGYFEHANYNAHDMRLHCWIWRP